MLDKNASTSDLLLKQRQSLDLMIPLIGNVLSVENEFPHLRRLDEPETENDRQEDPLNMLRYPNGSQDDNNGLPQLRPLTTCQSRPGAESPRNIKNQDYDIKIEDQSMMDQLLALNNNLTSKPMATEEPSFSRNSNNGTEKTRSREVLKGQEHISKTQEPVRRSDESTPDGSRTSGRLKKHRQAGTGPKTQEDTKNVLRNFGNSQNQYILYNPRCKQRIREVLTRPENFESWVRKLRLENFQQFKTVWQGEAGPRVYTRLYKQLCWKFYAQQAVCYVLNSRMKNESTRTTHLKYIYRFLEGIKDPSCFHYFKKASNESH